MDPSVITIVTVILISLTSGQQIQDTDDVSLVFAIFREGSRNPSNAEKFLSNPAFGGHYKTDEPWKRGSGRLNRFGKQQAYAFGQYLRKRYARFFTNNIDDILDFEIAKAFSANGACNQATLQLVLAGLFPATDAEFSWNTINSTGFWQPYLYSVNDRLTAAANSTCPELKRHFDAFKDDATQAAQQWLSDDHRIGTLFTERTGLNASLKHISELAEFLHILQSYNATLPAWLLETDKTPSTIPIPIIGDFVTAFNISNTTLAPPSQEPWITKFGRFRNAHAQLCSNDTECRRLVSGFFLNHILETLMLKREDKIPKRKFHLYSTRPETLASIAALFQLRSQDENGQSVSLDSLSGLVIEYRDNPQPSIRILSHDISQGDTVEGQSRISTSLLDTSYCPKQEWCRLDIVIKSVGLDTVDDWDKTCKTADTATINCPVGNTNIALVRDALTEQESSVPAENGKKLKSTECAFEWDKSGTRPCRNWASHGYCNLYDSVRWLFCRRTCLCNPEFL